MNVFVYFLHNSLIRFLTFGVGIAAAFIVTPHVLRSLGHTAYGIWSLIISITTYFLLLECGVYNSIAKKSAEAAVRKDQKTIDELYSSALALGGVNFLIVVLSCVIIASLAEMFFGESDYIGAIQYSIIISSITGGSIVFTRPAFGILAGAMRWKLLAFFTMSRTILSSIGAIIFLTEQLSAQENIFRMACITAMCFALESSAMAITVRLGGYATFRLKDISMERTKELLLFGLPVLVINLGDMLRNKTQLYVIGLMVGPVAVTLYSLARQFITYMQDTIVNVFGILNPYFSKLQAQENRDEYRRSLLEALLFSFTTSCLIGLGIILYGGPFMVRWIGPEYLEVKNILLPLAIAGIISFGETPVQGFLIGLGKHRALARVSLGLGILITIFSFPAAWLWGFSGVAWVVCILTLGNSLGVIPFFVTRAAEMPIWRYYLTILISLGPQVAAQLTYYYYIQDFLYPAYISIFLCAAGQVLVCSIVFFISTIHLLRGRQK